MNGDQGHPQCDSCGTYQDLVQCALEQPEGTPTGETIWLCGECWDAA